MHLETPRALIRDLTMRDVEFFVEMWANPLVTRYSGGPRDKNLVRNVLLEELDKPPVPNSISRWTVINKNDGRFIGECGLTSKMVDDNSEIELTYYFISESWNRGYATEAAHTILLHAKNKLQLPRVIALIHPDNIPSERVAVKLGFTFEKTLIRDSGPCKLYSIHF